MAEASPFFIFVLSYRFLFYSFYYFLTVSFATRFPQMIRFRNKSKWEVTELQLGSSDRSNLENGKCNDDSRLWSISLVLQFRSAPLPLPSFPLLFFSKLRTHTKIKYFAQSFPQDQFPLLFFFLFEGIFLFEYSIVRTHFPFYFN